MLTVVFRETWVAPAKLPTKTYLKTCLYHKLEYASAFSLLLVGDVNLFDTPLLSLILFSVLKVFSMGSEFGFDFL